MARVIHGLSDEGGELIRLDAMLMEAGVQTQSREEFTNETDRLRIRFGRGTFHQFQPARDSDATVIFSSTAKLTGGTLRTAECTRQLRKPCLLLQRGGTPAQDAAQLIAFIHANNVKVLNAIRRFNVRVIDEVHVPVTGRQAYIVSDAEKLLKSTPEGVKQVKAAETLYDLIRRRDLHDKAHTANSCLDFYHDIRDVCRFCIKR